MLLANSRGTSAAYRGDRTGSERGQAGVFAIGEPVSDWSDSLPRESTSYQISNSRHSCHKRTDRKRPDLPKFGAQKDVAQDESVVFNTSQISSLSIEPEPQIGSGAAFGARF